jgi:hypothetical protein
MTDLTKEQIDKIISMNQRLLYVMGVATSVLMDIEKYFPVEKKEGICWVLEAMNNLVYLNKSPPNLPHNVSKAKDAFDCSKGLHKWDPGKRIFSNIKLCNKCGFEGGSFSE